MTNKLRINTATYYNKKKKVEDKIKKLQEEISKLKGTINECEHMIDARCDECSCVYYKMFRGDYKDEKGHDKYRGSCELKDPEKIKALLDDGIVEEVHWGKNGNYTTYFLTQCNINYKKSSACIYHCKKECGLSWANR